LVKEQLPVSEYQLDEGVAHISMDDGKVNAIGLAAIASLGERLDEAEKDESASAIVLSGREGVFCAGFNLADIRNPESATALRLQFIDLVLRLFEFEKPVVVACTGHALGAGAGLLVVADRRIGAEGEFKLGFNEASVGVVISKATGELARYRMPMPWFESIITGSTFAPQPAVAAGLLDAVVADHDTVLTESFRVAREMAAIPLPVFSAMKKVARSSVAELVRLERSLL
jgi:enoyl-CoA hydratase